MIDIYDMTCHQRLGEGLLSIIIMLCISQMHMSFIQPEHAVPSCTLQRLQNWHDAFSRWLSCACAAAGGPVRGSLHNQQTILLRKWEAFWARRQLNPAWSQSAEPIQFAICLEQATMFQSCGHRLPDGQSLKQVPRPTRRMDCVLELIEPAHHLKPDKQLLQDLAKHASEDFGGVKPLNTW